MNELEKLIRERIRNEGPMTFEAFMETALYHLGLGYYTSQDTEIGRSGDFYTSPHLHPVFGAMLGRQAEEMWEILGHPAKFAIVEAGGGRGWLAKDILDYLKGKPIYECLSYTLAELNHTMRERQGKLLKEYAPKVDWVRKLGDIKPVTGLILTNELLDAFPVHLVEMGECLKEIYVTLDGEELSESPGEPSTAAIAEYFEEFGIVLPEGYRTEVNLRMRDWLGEAAAILKEGFILTIDYGYPAQELYSPERDRGTLLCYHRHQVNEDPFKRISEQDITAHINFTALKKCGEAFGLKSIGFTRQGPYLVALGIDEILSELMESSPDYGREISKVKGLIMPGGMGNTHKILIQYKGKGNPILKGFSIKNQINVL
jgi:SAM-dependent MidA family methyltransferase